MSRFDYQVKTSKGTIFTRSSDRVYTHAVVYTEESDDLEMKPEFCGRLDIAQKKSLPFWYEGNYTKAIYPVEIIRDRKAGK